MNPIVILAAISDELFPDSISGIKVIYTGIGKINAAYQTTKVILEQKPRLILNVGTAGVLTVENLGKLHDVRSVIERDFFQSNGASELAKSLPYLIAFKGTPSLELTFAIAKSSISTRSTFC